MRAGIPARKTVGPAGALEDAPTASRTTEETTQGQETTNATSGAGKADIRETGGTTNTMNATRTTDGSRHAPPTVENEATIKAVDEARRGTTSGARTRGPAARTRIWTLGRRTTQTRSGGGTRNAEEAGAKTTTQETTAPRTSLGPRATTDGASMTSGPATTTNEELALEGGGGATTEGPR